MVKGKKKSQRGGRRLSQPGGELRAVGDQQLLNTQSRLLLAAAKVFAKKGYDGASVKDIADEAAVNISLISYHFGGKEGLYRACLKSFGEETLESTRRILQPPKSFEEVEVRAIMIVEYLFDIFVKEPDLSQLAFKEVDLETEHVRDIFLNSFIEVYKTIIQFFMHSKNVGLIRQDIDPHTFTSLLFGAVSHYARMDKLGAKFFGRTIANKDIRDNVVRHFKIFFLEPLKQN